MNTNKSSAYGGYGGVSDEAHYVPLSIPDFIPQPPSIPFTTKQIRDISNALNKIELEKLVTFINTNSGDILLRNEVIDEDLTTDRFDMFTLNNPKENITLTVPNSADVVDILILNGGTF